MKKDDIEWANIRVHREVCQQVSKLAKRFGIFGSELVEKAMLVYERVTKAGALLSSEEPSYYWVHSHTRDEGDAHRAGYRAYAGPYCRTEFFQLRQEVNLLEKTDVQWCIIVRGHHYWLCRKGAIDCDMPIGEERDDGE